MSDYIDFRYNLKKISELCASDKRTQYTRLYKFEHPNCHRIQGGLQTGSGKIRVTLILFPDSDDKHLVWPANLVYKVLAYLNGKTVLLTEKEIQREAKDVEVFSGDISWSNSTSVRLKELEEKEMIGPDDSVTFIWSVKLCCPPPKSSEAATRSRSSSPVLSKTSSLKQGGDGIDLDLDIVLQENVTVRGIVSAVPASSKNKKKSSILGLSYKKFDACE